MKGVHELVSDIAELLSPENPSKGYSIKEDWFLVLFSVLLNQRTPGFSINV